MAYRWCPDCSSAVKADKVKQLPGLMMVIWGLFFTVVPFFGTVVGVPMLALSTIWWLLTPLKCSICESIKIEKKFPDFSPYPKGKLMTKKEIVRMFATEQSE